MKTKQEIEQLSISLSNPNICQVDMADTIKKAIEYGYQLRCNNKPINSGIDWVKEFKSLNK